MILLFTDFGWRGPYVGQLHLVLAQEAPGVPVIDLLHDAPAFTPRAAGHLLAALAENIPEGALLVAVVDPGVGSERRALLLEAGGVRYIGPDNGLLAPLAARYPESRAHVIEWRPQRLSRSFHGRDFFAPVAARLALGAVVMTAPLALDEIVGSANSTMLAEVIYIDGYGNAWTGLPVSSLPPDPTITVGATALPRAQTFSDVERGQAFWYENSAGLVEVAVNQDSAAARLGLQLGDPVAVQSSCDGIVPRPDRL